MDLIEPILHQMSNVAKQHRNFMFILLIALTYLPGRVSFIINKIEIDYGKS